MDVVDGQHGALPGRCCRRPLERRDGRCVSWVASPRGGAHLHASLADADGRVLGGHVAPGCIVRTTAEVLLALLDDVRFTREPDAATGYAELHVWPRGGA